MAGKPLEGELCLICGSEQLFSPFYFLTSRSSFETSGSEKTHLAQARLSIEKPQADGPSLSFGHG